MEVGAIRTISGLSVFKKSLFNGLDSQKCPCPERKSTPIKPFSQELLKDSFELQCCGKKK